MINDRETPTERQKDKGVGGRVLHAWYAAFKNVKLYKPDHPSSRESAKKFAVLLNNEALKERMEFSVMNLDGLFIINDSYFIEESLAHYELLHSLEDHNIPTVTFSQGITEDEAIALCDYLSKRRLPGMGDSGFLSDHIRASAKSKEMREAELKRMNKSHYEGRASYQRIKTLYDEFVFLTERLFAKLVEEQSVSILDLSEPIERLIDEMHQNPASFSAVMAKIPLTNLNVQHAVSTMIYSMFMGQQLALDTANMKTLALSALLHDIGRLFLPADFTTGYRLTKEDIPFIQLHARDGASYLSGVAGLPMNVVRVALEHHIGHDTKGYPALPGFQRPHFFSQIVSIADFVSWGTISERYYHKPIPMHRLVRTLMARAGTQFNPVLVKVFLPFLGLYPVGTRVQLSTGESAVVVEPNIRNITRPLIAYGSTVNVENTFLLATPSERSSGPAYEKSIKRILGRASIMGSEANL